MGGCWAVLPLKLSEIMVMFNQTDNSPGCAVGTIFRVIALSVIIRYLQAPALPGRKQRPASEGWYELGSLGWFHFSGFCFLSANPVQTDF